MKGLIFAPISLSFILSGLFGNNVSLTTIPLYIYQGDPFIVQVEGLESQKDIKSIIFNNKTVNVFTYKYLPSALIAVPLDQKPGDYTLTVILENGKELKKIIPIISRNKIVTKLGIPSKLGGNSNTSAKSLVSNLNKDNESLLGLKSNNHILWDSPFIFPVSNPIVTEPYGYSRKTNVYTIPHKGTDFHALIGTNVFAMNRGFVRLAQEYSTYGKTIVIDHGLGLQTIYMHLSNINVKVGDIVDKGQLIGLSGDTGYTLGPHLHLSVRVGTVSIDPIKFLDLFK